jgi:tetratricopeptide (TPR) repeat protein
MEPGSIEEVTARLKSWCLRYDNGLARVEWDSVYARQEVVTRLRAELADSHIPVDEISLPPGETAHLTVSRLIDKLQSRSGSAVSITDIEWAFPEGGSRLETLAALNFRRETLATLPVRQIWWIPSNLTEQFVLGIPDLESWFRLRLYLTEAPKSDVSMSATQTESKTVSTEEARAIARRFWERIEAARAQKLSDARIWTDLAEPAISALRAAGLTVEADNVLALAPDARARLDHEIKALTQKLGPDNDEVLILMDRLARLQKNHGDLKAARDLGEQIVEARRRVAGEDDTNTLSAMNNYAETLRLLGDYAGAKQLQERVLDVRKRTLGEDHSDTLLSAGNLAGTLAQLGDVAGARRLQEHVLEMTRRIEGEDHPDTLRATNNLAETLRAQGDLAGSQRLQEEALEARKRVLGDEHPDTLSSLGNLAITYADQGKLAEARRLQEKVLEISRRVLGEEHPYTLLSTTNLAATLSDQGDVEQARRLLERVLEARTRIFGATHPSTVNVAKFLENLPPVQ